MSRHPQLIFQGSDGKKRRVYRGVYLPRKDCVRAMAKLHEVVTPTFDFDPVCTKSPNLGFFGFFRGFFFGFFLGFFRLCFQDARFGNLMHEMTSEDTEGGEFSCIEYNSGSGLLSTAIAERYPRATVVSVSTTDVYPVSYPVSLPTTSPNLGVSLRWKRTIVPCAPI